MDFRTRRQLTVIAVIGIIGAGFAFWLYSAVAPSPTCQDRVRNQGEEAADCGGPCAPCAFKNRRSLEVFWARAVKTRENTYDVAAEISNPNVKLGATKLPYEVKLFDAAGVAVATRRGETFIYPGEVMHIVEIGLSTGRTVRNITVTIGEVEWMLSDEIGPDIIAANREYRIEEAEVGERSVVVASLANRTLADVPNITVTTLVFDEAENLVGVHQTVIGSIPAGSSESVRFVWPIVLAEHVGPVTIEARSSAFLLNPNR